MTKEKNKGGRPSKYNEEFIDEVDVYLEQNKDTRDRHGKLIVNLPTKEGLAQHLDVTKKTLLNWAEEHEEFLHALKKIDAEQQKRLLNSGLSGDYNSTIAKLILSSNHGMAEKTQQDHTSQGEKIEGFVLEFVKPNEAKATNS